MLPMDKPARNTPLPVRETAPLRERNELVAESAAPRAADSPFTERLRMFPARRTLERETLPIPRVIDTVERVNFFVMLTVRLVNEDIADTEVLPNLVTLPAALLDTEPTAEKGFFSEDVRRPVLRKDWLVFRAAPDKRLNTPVRGLNALPELRVLLKRLVIPPVSVPNRRIAGMTEDIPVFVFLNRPNTDWLTVFNGLFTVTKER